MSTTIRPDNLQNTLLKPTAQQDKAVSQPLQALQKEQQVSDQNHISSSRAAMVRQAEQSYGYSQTMTLELTTQEGDKVSVDFRQLYAQYQSYKESQSAQQGPNGVRYFESRESMEATAFEERFAFSVEGDLNEEELTAIFDVFEKVDVLANDFYGGNIEKAVEQAMQMEIDFGQLQSLQLNLSQTEVMSSSRQQAAQYQQNSDVPQSGSMMVELPAYLQEWQTALDNLDQWFNDSGQFWDNLMADTTSQRFPEEASTQGWLERVQSFQDKLLSLARANEALATPEAAAEKAENGVADDASSADVAVEPEKTNG